MVEGVADAFLEQPADLADGCVAEIVADHVAAQRQRQSGLFLPPDAEIDDQLQTLILKGELAFVNDEPGVVLARPPRRR